MAIATFHSLDFHRGSHLLLVGSSFAAGGLISVYAYRKSKLILERRRLRNLIKRKREERAAVFEELKAKYGWTREREDILETPTDELIDKLQAREVTAKEVLEAFILKSLQNTEQLNCITEYIPQAVEWAEKLDNLPLLKGPLHGIPFCVKDDHDVKGMDSTLGYAKFLYEPAAESAAIVKVLRDLGGVPFCKTNLPMSVFTWGSSNPVFGTTINANFPEKRFAPGGSSSGTGALVAGGGAIFGLGSDIGGSARIPAHCNGICSLRPTIGRFCDKGLGVRFMPGIVGLHGVSAILTPKPTYLTLVFKSIVEGNLQRKYDGTVVPVPWNARMFNSEHSLKIGYYTSLASFPAVGSTEKTVLAAKTALENRGHILVPFAIPTELEFEALKLYKDFVFADLGQNLKDLQYGEEHGIAMGHLRVVHVPIWLRTIGSAILQWIPGCQHIVNELRSGFESNTSAKLWKCMKRREILIDQLLTSMDKLQLDLILCPSLAFAALSVDDFHNPKLFSAAVYTMLWNFFDMPAGVVRFGTETGKDGRESRSDDSVRWKIANEAIGRSVGMPIGVQVVGKKFEEELVLRIMNELDNIYEKSVNTS